MRWVLKGLAIAALTVAGFFLLGFATMYLWNWLMPYLFQLPEIDFYMAIGLVALSKILFGGIMIRGNGWGQRKYWRAKWESMSAEERQQFKEDFSLRCRQKWGKPEVNTEHP